MLRARYIGYTKETENLGDECLIWIIKDLLAPEIDVGIDWDEYDIALLGGGTLINQSPWLIDQFESALAKARHGAVFGTGVGDPAFWGDNFERWTPLLRQCPFVGVRGPNSLAILKERGIDHACNIGDPFLLLQNPLERAPVPKRLGVNLGGTNDSLWGGNDKDLHDYTITALKSLKSKGWEFAWFSVWGKDIPALQRVRELVDPTSPPVIDARRDNLEALSTMAGCEVFLGEKLHACAMAAVTETPFVALEYQPKVRDFVASLGMTDWIVSTSERKPEVLIERIEKAREQSSEIRRDLAGAKNAIACSIREFAVRLKSHFMDKGNMSR